jgi:hypothetical protein
MSNVNYYGAANDSAVGEYLQRWLRNVPNPNAVYDRISASTEQQNLISISPIFKPPVDHPVRILPRIGTRNARVISPSPRLIVSTSQFAELETRSTGLATRSVELATQSAELAVRPVHLAARSVELPTQSAETIQSMGPAAQFEPTREKTQFANNKSLDEIGEFVPPGNARAIAASKSAQFTRRKPLDEIEEFIPRGTIWPYAVNMLSPTPINIVTMNVPAELE